MSEMSRKYKPPRLNRYDLESGMRYVEPEPQEDFLGQTLEVGDLVLYSHTRGRTAHLSIAKVIGMYTRVHSDGETDSGVGLVVQDDSWRAQGNLRKQTTYSNQLVKIERTDKIEKGLLDA